MSRSFFRKIKSFLAGTRIASIYLTYDNEIKYSIMIITFTDDSRMCLYLSRPLRRELIEFLADKLRITCNLISTSENRRTVVNIEHNNEVRPLSCRRVWP